MFTLFAVAGLALSVSAQKQDDKKPRPPKEGEKVEPRDKTKPRDNPPPRDGKKKPGNEFVLVIRETKTDLA
jgi:hypothetical protein